MKARKSLGGAALAVALALPALAPAAAVPLMPAPADSLRAAYGAPVHEIGYRYHGERRFHGGISYVGDYGLRYAPSYWYRRGHEHNVTINVYAEQPERKRYREGSRPLIIELPK